jgi:hypothetical protein
MLSGFVLSLSNTLCGYVEPKNLRIPNVGNKGYLRRGQHERSVCQHQPLPEVLVESPL